MKSDITVILLLYKTPLELIKNFKALKRFNIIVLDQSNDKILKKRLLKILPNIKKYILSEKNNGFAKGVNTLVKKVKTKYFFYTQADVIINENSILHLKKTILRHKKKAIAVIPSINKENLKKSTKDIEVKNMIGATFLCDKKRFVEIGMFDEDFFFYWEDIDFSKRVQNYDYKIYKNPKSKAIHRNGNSSVVGYKTDFIRHGNFIYGELLYEYKFEKIRFIKLLRKFVQNIFLLILNVLLFKFKNANINFAKIYGIIKFIKVVTKKCI